MLNDHQPSQNRTVVSVVIPTYKPVYLIDTLKGLAQQTTHQPFEVIVVENGDCDGKVTQWLQLFNKTLNITHIYQPESGLNRARNRGVKESNSAIILLIDDDCIPAANWIEQVLFAHDQFPKAGVIGGQTKLLFLDKPPRWLAGPLRILLSEANWSKTAQALRKGECLVGANFSFRKSIFDSVGGFEENIGMDGRTTPQLCHDETLFCYQVNSQNNPLIYFPDAVVSHQIPTHRLTPEYFLQRSYGTGQSTSKLMHMGNGKPITQSYLDELRFLLYDEIWLHKTLEPITTLECQSSTEYLSLSLACRLAHFQGLLDAANDQAPIIGTNLERKYYRYGHQQVARGIDQINTEAHSFSSLIQSTFEKLIQQSLRNSKTLANQSKLLGRIAYLKGIRDCIYESSDRDSNYDITSIINPN